MVSGLNSECGSSDQTTIRAQQRWNQAWPVRLPVQRGLRRPIRLTAVASGATAAQKLQRFALVPTHSLRNAGLSGTWPDSQFLAGSGQGRMTSIVQSDIGARDGAAHSSKQGWPASPREDQCELCGLLSSSSRCLERGSVAASQLALRAHLRPGKIHCLRARWRSTSRHRRPFLSAA